MADKLSDLLWEPRNSYKLYIKNFSLCDIFHCLAYFVKNDTVQPN